MVERKPARTDIVVIGGGIFGLSTAAYLARDGAGVIGTKSYLDNKTREYTIKPYSTV